MEINPRDLNTKDSHELFVSGILPRPIAFVSTVGEDGVFNLAAFSCFTMVGFKPALVCFHAGLKRDGVKKDTVVNIEFSRDFAVNIVDEALAEAMNQASAEYPSDVDEFKEVGLTPVKSELVRAPRVAESPVSMECKLTQILESGEAAAGGHIIIGEVVRVHIKDELWAGDQIDVSKLKPIGRLGGDLYCRITDIFEMKRAFIL
ncbi:MAG: flavin reductase family protein [Deltaproteobacteria bacterium]|nr:flavin reductase family protein [Deltaproteobacteria bacterium]